MPEEEYNVHIDATISDTEQITQKKKKIKSEISKRNSRNKKVGNREENKVAKILGEWIFDDKHALHKHDTSGARKEVYIGDIVPQKQIKWPIFFLNIEVKNGYADNYPDFWNHHKIKTFFNKCIKDSEKSKEQKLILLITQFKNRQKLLTTNYCIKTVPFKVSIPIDWDHRVFAFVYLLKDVMAHNFDEIFDVKTILNKLGYTYEYTRKRSDNMDIDENVNDVKSD